MNSIIKGIWRFLQPLRSYGLGYPVKIWGAYFSFYKSWKQYKKLGGQLSFRYNYPYLNLSNHDVQSGGGQYFYQDIWALKILSKLKPEMHFDIGSRFDGFTGQATAICPVTSIDIRPPSFVLPGLHFLKGDILALPFENDTISTLSCLHTIEHIGLGRYGDAINPKGFEQSLTEMQRVIAPGGHLLLSMPVGKERTEFNAQRILDPLCCIHLLDHMQLKEFSIINDKDEFIDNAVPGDYCYAKNSCGLYLFQKKQTGIK